MAKIIAEIALALMVVSVPLIIIRPHWVFYIFLFSTVFEEVFYSYIYAAGGLGASRTWSPADFLSFWTLFAVLFVKKEQIFPSDTIKTCLFIVTILSVICLVQGFALNGVQIALPDMRKLYFVPAMLFAAKYLTDVRRVNTFLKFSAILLIAMFTFHLMLRLRIITAPEEFKIAVGEAGVVTESRGELLLAPVLYFVLASMGIGRLAMRYGRKWFSFIMLLCGIMGVGLAESRTLHGGIVVIGIASMVFVRGRIKTFILLGLVLLLVLWLGWIIGMETLFSRWQGQQRFKPDFWRMEEYSAIINSYKQQPYFLLTGRGLGAQHFIASSFSLTSTGMVSGYHSEFIEWLDAFGLIGLGCLLIIWIVSLYQSFALLQSGVPLLMYCGATTFLVMSALFLHSIFSPSFMNVKGAATLICFVVLISNWREIYYNSYQSWCESDVDTDEEQMGDTDHLTGITQQAEP